MVFRQPMFLLSKQVLNDYKNLSLTIPFLVLYLEPYHIGSNVRKLHHNAFGCMRKSICSRYTYKFRRSNTGHENILYLETEYRTNMSIN